MVYCESVQIVRGRCGVGSISRMRATACEGGKEESSSAPAQVPALPSCEPTYIHLRPIVRLLLPRQPFRHIPARTNKPASIPLLLPRQDGQLTSPSSRDSKRSQSPPCYPPCRSPKNSHHSTPSASPLPPLTHPSSSALAAEARPPPPPPSIGSSSSSLAEKIQLHLVERTPRLLSAWGTSCGWLQGSPRCRTGLQACGVRQLGLKKEERARVPGCVDSWFAADADCEEAGERF